MNAEPRGRDVAVLWVAAILLATLLLVSMLKAMNGTQIPASGTFYDYNAARVDSFAEPSTNGAIRIVMLGDSRLRYATEIEDELSAAFSTELGADVEVLRIVNNWATYEDFAPLMPLLEAADPAMIILQDDLRLKNYFPPNQPPLQIQYAIWRAFGSGSWDPWKLDQRLLQEENRCEVLTPNIDARAERLRDTVDFDPEGETAARVASLEDDLRSAGIELRYLVIPVTRAADEQLPRPSEIATPPLGLVPAVDFTDEHYCDSVHMDPNNRAAYTEWLVSTVSSQLRSKIGRTT